MQSASGFIEFQKPFISAQRPRLAIGFGVFDGVHTGHQKIIRELSHLAELTDSLACAVTFSPHPKAVTGSNPPDLLLPLPIRMKYLRDAGAEYCGVINFNTEFAAISADDFLEQLINAPGFELAAICVGKNWHFGYQGCGNTEKIAEFCQKHNIVFSAVREHSIAGRTASSSLIRELIAAGDLKGAEAMLDRPVQLFGSVVHGNQVAGSILKTPTANLQVSAGILPPDGVYAGSVELDGKWFHAAVNIGLAPTFSVGIRRVEIHLLDCQCDLYDREITLQLHRFIRKERHFSSADELKAQIAADIEIIRAINIPG